jgi:6-pyruvoyltetrahydropterin/6-carboxytetrahydropterin synthase
VAAVAAIAQADRYTLRVCATGQEQENPLWASIMRIYKDFKFEAAHFLPSAPKGSPNARIHGHSFRVRVSVDGQPDSDTGLIMHLDDLDAALTDVRSDLDHQFLNEVEGLAVPTLENITRWIWNRLDNQVPGLAEIEISRDSCGEGCIYRGSAAQRQAAE